VHESDEEKVRLHQELQETEDSFWREMSHAASGWQLIAGPVRIRAVVRSETITLVYVAFNAACFIAGTIFIFAGGVLANLGIAIVVGAIFAFGSFVAQFWAVAVQNEREVRDRVFVDDWTTEMKRLAEKRTQLIERLRQARPDSDSIGDRTQEEHPSGPTVAGL
jgi:hypothetical protein